MARPSPPEHDILRAFVRTALGEPATVAPATLRAADPQRLADLAGLHGVARALAGAIDTTAAPELAAALHVAAHGETLYTLIARAELPDLDARLADAGIPAVALKGAALHLLGHHDRPVADIDLLVRHADLAAAGGVLEAAGYWRDDPVVRLDWAEALGPTADYVSNTAAPVRVELHTLLSLDAGWNAPYVGPRLADGLRRATEGVWATAIATPGWRALRVPAPDVMLFHTLEHMAARHLFFRLRWALDARLLAAPEHWPGVARLARQTGAAAPIALAIRLCRAVVALPAPAGLARELWREGGAAERLVLGRYGGIVRRDLTRAYDEDWSRLYQAARVSAGRGLPGLRALLIPPADFVTTRHGADGPVAPWRARLTRARWMVARAGQLLRA